MVSEKEVCNAGLFQKKCPYGVHPNVVYRVFNIHLRTVFRLFKRGLLHSVSEKSLLAKKDEVLKALTAYHLSCSLEEACDKLGVTRNTIVSWRNKEILREVRVFGFSRITTVSLQALLLLPNYRPEKKKVLLNTETVETIRTLLQRKIEMRAVRIETKAKKKAGKRLRDELNAFEKTEATRRKERLEVTKKRAPIRTPVTDQLRQQLRIYQKPRKVAVRLENNVITELYKPKTQTAKKQAGTKRLVTVTEAAKFLEIPASTIPILYLRNIEVDGETLLYANAVEAYKSRM